MTDSERLKEIIKSSKMSTKAFSESIGLKTPQILYDILKDRNGISKDVAKAIQAKCLHYNFAWIISGEGEKYKSVEYKDKPFCAVENSVNNIKEPYTKDDQVRQLTNIVDSQQQTIDRLSKTVEDLMKKKNGTKGNGTSANSA